MKVVLAHNDYGRFSGEENAVETMASVLSDHGHEVKWLRKSSVVIGDSLTQKTRALFSGLYSSWARKRMNRMIADEHPDLIQVQNLYPFLSPSILEVCKENGLPVVMRCPNYRIFCPTGLHLHRGKVCERCLNGYKEWSCIVQNCEGAIFKSIGYAARNAFARISGMIMKNVDVFIVLSNFQKEKFVARGIPVQRVAILPNIVPLELSKRPWGPGEFIAFVGRVSEEKGIMDFLAAAARMPEYRFRVAGSTDSMPDIERRAPSNVTFTGFLIGKELDEFFESSRILVFPGRCYEGFPNVIAKAMAHKKPVVASRIGAIPEIVQDQKTGLLFEPGNPDDLVDKLELLVENSSLCRSLGEAGLCKAEKEYSAERYYEILMGIYQKALRNNDAHRANV